MNGLLSPTVEDVARERIEAAVRELTFCTACGAPMRLTVRDEELWSECSTLEAKHGLRLSIAAGFHDRRVVELPEGALAA
jgi:hypothetical protein